MAQNILETRILLRYGTYSQWMNSDLILSQGEAAICVFPRSNNLENVVDGQPDNTPPAIGIKIGDGTRYFYELPWVQAVAADVYMWAKNPTKPTYTASEITGLAEYINAQSGGSGGVSTGYRISYNSNTSKYTLESYDEESDSWEPTTGDEVDLSGILNRINTIERWANGARTRLGNIELPLDEYIYGEVLTYLNALDYNDQAVPHEFVTSVIQEDGQITVTRTVLSASDITTGILGTAQGGTGLSNVNEDELLIGSEQGTITTKRFITFLDPSDRNTFATTGAIIDYITQQTAGLTGAMHFIGEAGVAISQNSRTDPRIYGYDFRNAQPGDVILANNAQEYVWTGEEWRLLGDEGSYAIKGSIVNADISENAAIDQTKISGLEEALAGKVDVEEGKGLSSNDFTDEDKEKLDQIDDNAEENVIEHIFLNGEEVEPGTYDNTEKSVALVVSEFDATSRAKLNNIEAGAQVNAIEQVIYDGQTINPDATKTIRIVSNPHTDHINVIEHILVNGVEQVPDANKSINISVNQSDLNLNVLEGAIVPDNAGGTIDVPQNAKKLQLARIAMTGNVQDLTQTTGTYIILNCGTSTTVI